MKKESKREELNDLYYILWLIKGDILTLEYEMSNNCIWENVSIIDLPGEKWKDIKGFEGQYRVSNMGRVKSLSRYVSRMRKDRDSSFETIDKILVPSIEGAGYHRIVIAYKTSFKLHRLVAEYFLKRNPKFNVVNHKNGVKKDNRASNLEWCTTSMNNKHAFKTGLKKSKFQMFGAGNPKSKPVCQYTKENVFIKQYPGQSEASRQTGISQSMIWCACNHVNRVKTAGGFIWKYAPGYGLGDKGASIHSKKKI